MSREQSYNTIILKKTPFNEADEIITVLTEEKGKMRFLAKSVKLAKSKLQNSLQSLCLCALRTANFQSNRLGKIIGSQPKNLFPNLRQNMSSIKSAYSAAEIAIKFLPDEQPNAGVFRLFKIFLEFLNNPNLKEWEIEVGLLGFKIKFLELIGLGIIYPKFQTSQNLSFDSGRGGFVEEKTQAGFPASAKSLEFFTALKSSSFKNLPKFEGNFEELKNFIDAFLEHQLERELRAEKSMRNVL